MPIRYRLITAATCVFLATGAVHAQWDLSGTASGAASPTYMDPAGRFWLQTPAGWKAATKNGTLVFQSRKSALTVFFHPGEHTPSLMLDAPAERVREAANGFVRGAVEIRAVGPYEGRTLDFTAASPEHVASKGRITAITNGRDGMVFILTTPIDDFKADDAAVNAALATLNIVSKADAGGTVLAERTPIHLILGQNIKSGHDLKGASIWYRVAEPVLAADGRVLIAEGAVAHGAVLRSEKRRMFGKPGKLEIGVNSVPAVDGTLIPLRAIEDISARGRSNADAVTATALLLTPVTLFVKGRDVTLKEGTEITAYVDHDVRLDLPDAAPAPAPPATTAREAADDAKPAAETQPTVRPAQATETADAAS
jgi:hypothetical protein